MSQVFCGQCGTANPDGSRFCSNCGQGIKNVDPPPVQPSYQQPPQPPPPQPPPPQAPPQPAQVYHQPQNIYQQASPVNPVGAGEWFGFGCLTLFIPLLGLIMSIVWMSQKRPGAGGCLAATIIYMVLGTIAYIVFVVIGASSGMLEGGY